MGCVMPDVLRIAKTYRVELETEVAKLDKFMKFAGDLMAGTATAFPFVSVSTVAPAKIDLPEPTVDLTEMTASEPEAETQSEQLSPIDEPKDETQSEQLAQVEHPEAETQSEQFASVDESKDEPQREQLAQVEDSEADSTDTDPSADPEDLDMLREKLDDLRATLSTPTAPQPSVEEADSDGRVLLSNGRPSLFKRTNEKNCERQAVVG